MQCGAPAPHKKMGPNQAYAIDSIILSSGICAVTFSDTTSQVILSLYMMSVHVRMIYVSSPKSVQEHQSWDSGSCCHAMVQFAAWEAQWRRSDRLATGFTSLIWGWRLIFQVLQPAPGRSTKQTTANSEHTIASLNMFISLSFHFAEWASWVTLTPIRLQIQKSICKATSSNHNKASLQCRSDIENNPTVTWNWFYISLMYITSISHYIMVNPFESSFQWLFLWWNLHSLANSTCHRLPPAARSLPPGSTDPCPGSVVLPWARGRHDPIVINVVIPWFIVQYSNEDIMRFSGHDFSKGHSIVAINHFQHDSSQW